MSPLHKKLVELYALSDVERVRRDKTVTETAFGRTLEELDADIEFSRARDFVAEIKQKIESREQDWSVVGDSAQVGACLRLVLDIVLFDHSPKTTVDLRMDVTKELFIEIFKGKWGDKQIAHVNLVLDMLKDWASFFISYTNRSPRMTNDLYRKVITTFVEPTIRKTRNWDTDNLLVDAVVTLLRRENLLHGFYDRINIQVSDNLEDKIGPAAGGSFMFVQLVQLDTFSAAPPPPNWCFEEYQIFHRLSEQMLKNRETYRDAFRKRFAPILADDVRPAALPFEYEPWVARVFKENRYEKLPVDPQQFANVVHKLALEIVNLHVQIIDCVPA